MKWNSVKDGFPKDKRVLVSYLNPFFGKFTSDITVACYNDDGLSSNASNKGWVDIHTETNLFVTHWMDLPLPSTDFDGIEQTPAFLEKYGGHPNYGTVK
jgi:hypothetical protein